MKNKGFLLLAAVIVMVAFGWQSANAQTRTTIAAQDATVNSIVSPDVVSPGSTHKYAVDFTTRGGTDNVYTWSIIKTDATYAANNGPAVLGTDYTITPGAHPSLQSIKWLATGTSQYYNVTLTEANPPTAGGCTDAAGLPKVMNVQVVAGTIEFTSITGVNQCPSAGSYSAALTITGVAAGQYPLTITYSETINGTTTTGHTVSLAAAGPLVIPAGDNFLANATLADDAGRKVQITGVTDNYSGTITIITAGGVDTQTLTVWALPQTTPISHD
jgi:hypothetical protein